jgi:hypothetical protein
MSYGPSDMFPPILLLPPMFIGGGFISFLIMSSCFILDSRVSWMEAAAARSLPPPLENASTKSTQYNSLY